jgi:arsenite-transporting ATPase
MRIFIFTGNGGSGVSTVAAAAATALAESGERTLAFGITRGLGAALDVDAGLDAAPAWDRLDVAEGHGGYGRPDEFREWLRALLDWRGMDAELADDLSTLPGVNHIGRLLALQRLLRSDAYDCAVLDAADAAQFLDLPGALEAGAHWLNKLFAPRQSNVFEPFLRAFAGDYASAGEEVFETGKDLLGRLADVRDMLSDPETTSVSIVANPNEAGVKVVRDVVSVLSLFGYRVDAMIVTRLLPATVSDPFFEGTKAAQKDTIKELQALNLPLRLMTSELQAGSVKGKADLLRFSASLFGKNGVELDGEEGHVGDHTIERESGQYVVIIMVPFARKEDLKLEDGDDGIVVHLNGRRRVIELPNDVLYTEAVSWVYEDHVLRVVLDR